MIRTLLITDTETTGLDPQTDRVIEVACVAFDVERAIPIEAFSSLVRADANPAEAVNHIPAAALASAPTHEQAWGFIERMAERQSRKGPAAFVAHRAEFDRGFYPKGLAERLPWLCSKFDFDWPLSKPGDSLVQVAVSHGVPVIAAHRAMTDCDMLVRIFARCRELGHDIARLIERAARPKARFLPEAKGFDEERNKLLKANGFQWYPEMRVWSRTMAIEDAAKLPFKVVQVSP